MVSWWRGWRIFSIYSNHFMYFVHYFTKFTKYEIKWNWRKCTAGYTLCVKYHKNARKCEKKNEKHKWCIGHYSSYSLCLLNCFSAFCVLSLISQRSQLSCFLTKRRKNSSCDIRSPSPPIQNPGALWIVYSDWNVFIRSSSFFLPNFSQFPFSWWFAYSV